MTIAGTHFDAGVAAASSLAPRVDTLFFTLVAASALLVGVLVTLNVAFLIRYRRGSTASRAPLPFPEWVVEVFWIVATTIVFLGIFAWGADIFFDMARAPAGAAEISVTGRQWMWDVRQANGRREFNELHVPVAQPIRLLLQSEDVIHSFFVPAFRLKQDVVPGKTVSTWFEATKPGSYPIFCAQFCGTEHAAMIGRVVVMAPEDYAAWLESGNIDTELASRGRRLFVHYGCSGCHTPGATVHAPALEGIYQSRVPLQDGAFVTADDAYLRDSILEPKKQIVAGYAPVMPEYKGVIPEGDLLDLLAYLKGLQLGERAESRPLP